MGDGWRNGRRNGRNTGKQCEEHRRNATVPQLVLEVDHLSFSFIKQARMLASSEAVLPKPCEFLATLMALIYTKQAFAKMTGLPDKLIETPHTYACRGH